MKGNGFPDAKFNIISCKNRLKVVICWARVQSAVTAAKKYLKSGDLFGREFLETM